MKEIKIHLTYNRGPITIPKGIGFNELYAILKTLEGKEITHVDKKKE